MKRVQGKAIRIVVDVAGELLNRVLKHRPFLIKPNHHELGICSAYGSMRSRMLSLMPGSCRRWARRMSWFPWAHPVLC